MKHFLLFFFTIFTVAVKAQNLVVNPSFEDTVSCPFDGAMYHLIGWDNAGGTPDYFNSCCSTDSPDFSVPNNWGGYQPASTGNAYCAVGTYQISPPFTDIREFIIAPLTAPLVIGNDYIVSFKTNLSIRDTMYFNLASNNIGALLSTVPYNVSNPAPINNFAHVYSTSIITDTMNWTTISGIVTADSAYQYITIGNFFNDLNTDTTLFYTNTYQTAYYYIDDVSIILDTSSGIEQNELFQQIEITNSNGTIQVHSSSPLATTVTIYNIMGQSLFQKKLFPYDNYIFNMSEASSSIYFIEANNERLSGVKKIFFNK